MNSIRFGALAAAAFIIVAGAGGCYTMIVHPSISMTDENTGAEEVVAVDHTQRCTDCHNSAAQGSMHAVSVIDTSASEGWYDYDPFYNFNDYGYYGPELLGGGHISSHRFYRNYNSYRAIPWWVGNNRFDDYGSLPSSVESAPVPREKPVRRGGENQRVYTPPAVAIPAPGNTDKPSASSTPEPAQNGSTQDDNGKEKPARRGGMK
jgi:hypothetical protein